MRLLIALFAVALVGGCKNLPTSVSKIVAGQTPGEATGAGAVFVGPANSAAPSTQVATRQVGYYPPPVKMPLPRFVPTPAPQPQADVAPVPPETPVPAWVNEHVETTFGQHQDAAGIVKVATSMGGWGSARWLGILCMLGGAFGLAWAHGNPDGYPVVCWKVGGVGLVLAIFDPNPWWILLLLIPAGFYLAQKLNLLKLPL